KYSRFMRWMSLTRIPAGQAASHSLVLLQLPKPSASIWCTIATTRRDRSRLPCGRCARCETFAAVNNIAEAFLQAATHAPQPMHADEFIAASDWSRGTGSVFASGAWPVLTET